ncbi:MAG: hypothetical protein HZB59_06225 [Ignavibacteriales bacterium]|nr:hypothetical protein [Ignavibacteriales bacterium]
MTKVRNVGFVLLGVAGLIFKGHYSGPAEYLIKSYLGNIAISFAVYFITIQVPISSKYKRVWSAVLALVIVESFEIFDGFGIFSNVYDSLDLLANVFGILFALIVDTVFSSSKKIATDK